MLPGRAGAGQRLTTEAAVEVSTGGDQAETEENSRAVGPVMVQLGLPPLGLRRRAEAEVELADLADQELFGQLEVLRLELVSVTSQTVQADCLPTGELRADSSLRNTN